VNLLKGPSTFKTICRHNTYKLGRLPLHFTSTLV
jgi:hypothetical protein